MAKNIFYRRTRFIACDVVGYVIESDDDSSLYYYGTTTFSDYLPYDDDQMEEYGFIRATQEVIAMVAEDQAIYNAEMRHAL